MLYGWAGKIAHINLTSKNIHIDSPELTLYEKWIGGRGLAGYYLRSFITHAWDDPQMPLCLFNGPLTATSAPTSGRMTIMSRSPLTGTIGDSSVGGRFANQLKRAGFDGIVISGQSDELCGIEIDDHLITIVSAQSMSGWTTSQVFQHVKQKSVACIGPAAENNVRFACVMVDHHHAAGRNGLGLIFSSKKIKYIAVSGSQRTKIFDPEGLKKARQDILRLTAASPIISGEHGLMYFGTGALFDLIHLRRMMPTQNFKKTFFENAPKMNAYAYHSQYETRQTGCKGCHILCKRKHKDTTNVLPEFETMSHFSALIENEDIHAVVEANRLCNELGMDTISAAATISAYAESHHIQLDSKQILQLLHDIAYRKNNGVLLAQGSQKYCQSQNKINLSMSVKSQELPAYDPRGAYGIALAYATSTRGGCHLRAYPISHEILRKPSATNRFSWSGKARIIKLAEDTFACVDSLIACKFVFLAASLEEFAQIYSSVTGVFTNMNMLQKIGERISYHERIMNAMNGYCAQNDDLPERFFKEPGMSGDGIEIPPLSRSEFLETRQKYYRIRGLSENGEPTAEKAYDLELRL